MVKIFEHVNVSAPAIETFKERLEKRRQAISLTYIGDTYIMGGILFYCGILLPVLVSLGTSDSSTRLAWIAFAVSLPCTVGFFLVRFLKKKNNISNYGVMRRRSGSPCSNRHSCSNSRSLLPCLECCWMDISSLSTHDLHRVWILPSWYLFRAFLQHSHGCFQRDQ